MARQVLTAADLHVRREEMLSEMEEEYVGGVDSSDAALADARRLTQYFAGQLPGTGSLGTTVCTTHKTELG